MSPSSAATVNRLAREIGCTILMNGSDSDSIVGSGLELLIRETLTVHLMTLTRLPDLTLSLAKDISGSIA